MMAPMITHATTSPSTTASTVTGVELLSPSAPLCLSLVAELTATNLYNV